jgi:hypothetical protein
VQAYAKASIRGDERRMAEVLREVEEWNRANEGTEFYINNFRQKARRSLNEGNRTALARYYRTVRGGEGEPSKQALRDMAEAYGYATD